MESRSFVYIALVVDIVIAATKFIAAGITHSSAMLSEGIHSIIDASSQVLLILGIVTSNKKPDNKRPFGYGRELYFWSFIVSLIMFLLGGCISLYQGIMRFKSAETIDSPTWSYIVILIAFVFTGISAWSSFKVFRKKMREDSFFDAVKKSKDPSTFIILLGDIADLARLIIALGGVYLSQLYHTSWYDALASVLIGVVLLIVSILLVKESRSLLMGEPVSKKTLKAIAGIAETDSSIVKVKRKLSIYLAPEEIVLQLTAVFRPGLTTSQITDSITTITKKIQEKFPLIKQIFIEPVKK
jgi:cation diffusion facilitator family transporter